MSTIEINLKNGMVGLIDEGDWAKVNHIRWAATVPSPGSSKIYVQSTGLKNKIYLHRLLMKAPVRLVVDHINGNGLDNRRENLRLATRRQNSANKMIKKLENMTSKYVGVIKTNGKSRPWAARRKENGKLIYLGAYEYEVDAAIAYDLSILASYGEFASTNFPLRLLQRLSNEFSKQVAS